MGGREIAVLGVPWDQAANRTGASQGPAAIRHAGLLDALRGMKLRVSDRGDLDVPARPAAASAPSKGIKNRRELLRMCSELASRTRRIVSEDALPLLLGGDHSIAIGSILGIAGALREKNKRLGVVWVDAHADINTPATSPSKNAHGMPVAHILGMGDRGLARLGGFAPKVAPENFCLIGVRDVDDEERKNLRDSGVRAFSMHEIDRRGIAAVVDEALALAGAGTAGFHLSFDIDAVDPRCAPGTSVPKDGGLTVREAHFVMEAAAESGKILSLEMAEVNPLADVENATAALACELIASALGKRILL
jgi:arginase